MKVQNYKIKINISIIFNYIKEKELIPGIEILKGLKLNSSTVSRAVKN